MNKFRETYGPWACIAGSAEGLGEAWSTSLAAKGLNIIMVDRLAEANLELASRLENEYHISAETVRLDLAAADTWTVILEHMIRHDARLLIYNAAYSKVKPFLANTNEELGRYVEVNCRTPLALVNGFAGHLRANRLHGGIVLMSSLAGLYGTRLLAPYGATKAFNWLLAEALHHELKQEGIDVLTCIAGATSTPAYLATQPDYGWIRPRVMSPAVVAEKTLGRLGRQARYIPGISNRFMFFIFSRLLPRKVAAGLFNYTTKRMYSHNIKIATETPKH